MNDNVRSRVLDYRTACPDNVAGWRRNWIIGCMGACIALASNPWTWLVVAGRFSLPDYPLFQHAVPLIVLAAAGHVIAFVVIARFRSPRPPEWEREPTILPIVLGYFVATVSLVFSGLGSTCLYAGPLVLGPGD